MCYSLGLLILSILQRSPRPYSNYEGPDIIELARLPLQIIVASLIFTLFLSVFSLSLALSLALSLSLSLSLTLSC